MYRVVMERRFEPRVFEATAFLLMLVFGFATVAFYYLNFIWVAILLQSSFTDYRLVYVTYLLRGLTYLLIPVLLFITFYKLCGRNIPARVASTVISLVLGGLAGMVVGGLFMSGVDALATGVTYAQALTTVLPELEYTLVHDVLLALAAVALTLVVKRWDEALMAPGEQWSLERPVEVSFASGIYVVCGVLTLCVLPILFLLPLSVELNYLTIEVSVIGLVAVAGVGQLIIGRGVYGGRRWAWVAALLGSIVGLAVNVQVLAIFALYPPLIWETVSITETVSSLVSLVLDLAVLGLIFTENSRVYCTMVDVQTYVPNSLFCAHRADKSRNGEPRSHAHCDLR